MHYIYVYENKINGKVYVGQTKDLKKRDNAHIYNQHNLHIDNAINVYGRDNFDYWIINIVSTEEQADQEEIFWISEMRRCLGAEMIYNKSDGGDASMRGRKHTPETISKMSDSRKGINNPNYGKKKPGFTNSGSFKAGMKVSHNHKGKTWKLIDGKRVWLPT
jgi:group I intron endonuclease